MPCLLCWCLSLSNRNKTLKPQKSHKDGKHKELSTLAKHTLATLGSGSMLQAVKLPKGEDQNEWLSANTSARTHSQETTDDARMEQRSAAPTSHLLLACSHSCFCRCAFIRTDFFNELNSQAANSGLARGAADGATCC